MEVTRHLTLVHENIKIISCVWGAPGETNPQTVVICRISRLLIVEKCLVQNDSLADALLVLASNHYTDI